MTRKDFQLIADVIKATHRSNVVDTDDKAIAILTESLAIELAKTNPRFNKALFIKACGVNQS
tara:strand:- start:236 stop:421 length:186 start_codon:yes stop_codon:yes gene_type:complete